MWRICPAEKNQKVLISVLPPLFHVLSHSIIDTEVNVKKKERKPPTHKEKQSQTLIGFTCLMSFLWHLNSKTGPHFFPADYSDLTFEFKVSCPSVFKYIYHYHFNHIKTILLTRYFNIIYYMSSGVPWVGVKVQILYFECIFYMSSFTLCHYIYKLPLMKVSYFWGGQNVRTSWHTMLLKRN